MPFHSHSIIRSGLIATLVLAALPCSVQAQGNMRLQFMTFPMTSEPLEVEMFIGEGRTTVLKVPSNEFSETLDVPRLSTLVFGKTVFDEVKKAPTFKIYGQGTPAAAPKQLVLLLRKGATMAEGLEVRAISCDVNDFAGGKLLFINATSTDVAGKSGKTTFSLKPGKNVILTPGLEPNGRLTHVEFYFNKEGKAVPFFSSVWPVSKQYRGVIFFYNDPNNANKIQLHSFRDFLPEGG